MFIHIVRYLVLHGNGINGDYATIGERQLNTGGVHVELTGKQSIHTIFLP